MSRSRRRWLGAFPVLLGACAGGWQSSDLSGLPTAERYPGAPAVVVRDEQEVVFHSGVDGRPVADESVHRLVRVLRPGAERLDTIVLTYSREFERVTSFRARTVADSGAVRRFDDYVDYPASDNTFFSDERAVRLDVSPVSPGSVIEYRYTMRYQEPRLFHFGHTFGNLYPVVEARLVVRAPRDWTVEHVERLLGEPVALPPREEFDGNDRLLVWEKRDLPPLQLPPASPPLSELAPTVSVRLATWRENGALVSAPSSARELSAWGARFSADAPFPAVKARAEQILAGVAPDPESRARALYGWVRDHVKYCAIEVGYGRWRPHAAEEVDRTRYGDCKDKANLLKALLDAAGIRSRLVSIFSHHGYPRAFVLPTLTSNFNHIILQVDLPSGSVLTDPTSEVAPFGRLPAGDQEAHCLPLDEAGLELQRSAASSDDANLRETQYQVALDEDGAASGSYRVRASGHEADQLRAMVLHTPHATLSKAMMRWLGVPDGEWSTTTFEHEKPAVEPSDVEARGGLKLPHFTANQGAVRLLRLSEVAPRLVPWLGEGPRRGPAVWQTRYRRIENWSIQLPGGLRPGALPSPTQVDSEFGSYQLSWSAAGDVLRVERRLSLREHIVSADRLPAFRAFLDDVQGAEARAVALKTGGAP